MTGITGQIQYQGKLNATSEALQILITRNKNELVFQRKGQIHMPLNMCDWQKQNSFRKEILTFLNGKAEDSRFLISQFHINISAGIWRLHSIPHATLQNLPFTHLTLAQTRRSIPANESCFNLLHSKDAYIQFFSDNARLTHESKSVFSNGTFLALNEKHSF